MIVNIRRRCGYASRPARPRHTCKVFWLLLARLFQGTEKLLYIVRARDLDFKGNLVFGALSPVSVNAARQRLEAGAAKAPQGRRGQVAGEDVRAYTSLPARRPYVGPVARAALASRRVALARLVRAVARDPYRRDRDFHTFTSMKQSRENGVRSIKPRQRKRCAATPRGRRGQVTL